VARGHVGKGGGKGGGWVGIYEVAGRKGTWNHFSYIDR
jgi:hypothetical protein